MPAGLAVFALLLTMAATAAPASAELTHLPLGFSPITGSGSGVTIHLPSGIAIDETTGNVFLNDGTGGNVVDILGAEGGAPVGLVSPYTITGFSFGSEPSGAAVDNAAASPSKGTLYVADVIHHKLKEFVRNAGTELYEAAGELTATTPAFGEVLGVAVDSHGNVFVADYNASSVVKFSPTGTQLARISVSGSVERPSSIALDNAGDLFVQGYGGGKVVKYPANGSGEIEPAVFAQVVASGGTGVAVDTGANRLYVALGNHVNQYNATTLAQQGEFGAGTLTTTTRLAVNSATGRIYVSDNGSGKKNVAVFGPPVVVPTLTITAASGITDTAATLNGTVNPDGVAVTECKFEYGLTTGYGTTKPCVGAIPTDSENHAVTALASGLTPNTAYHFRLAAANANGQNVSKDATFITATAPEVLFSAANSITDTSARLLAQVHPHNAATSYQFKWGTTESYGNSTPVPPGTIPAGTEPVVVDEEIAGLEPSTTYHFHVVVANLFGNDSSEDVSFTTRAAQPQPGPCPNEVFRTDPYTSLSDTLPECRAYEMVSSPFKATRASGEAGGSLHRNPGVGLASPSGERLLWHINMFPLSNEVAFPFSGDVLEIHRTATGWVSESQLTQAPLPDLDPSFKGAYIEASSADFEVQGWKFQLPILENESNANGFLYTRKDGTGTNGFSNWLANVKAATAPYGLASPEQNRAQFNDDGSSMVAWGGYRGLLGAIAAQDPSVTQLSGENGGGGKTIYLQGNPPAGPLDLVNGCTGTAAGADATQIPTRVGTGVATDTIGTRACQRDVGQFAAGTATRTSGSPTLTGLTTESGAFAVGQMAFGSGIPRGAVITAVGAGTLTLSANAQCGQAAGTANRTFESPTLTNVVTTCGAFADGQTITGTGIPASTTIVKVPPEVPAGTLELSKNATSTGPNGAISVTAPALTNLFTRAQSIVSTRGAVVGGGNQEGSAAKGTAATAMSDNGRRVFFESPDPAAGPAGCATTTGPATNCPPQLYLRQYEPEGENSFANPIVRWVSRSRSTFDTAAFVATGARQYGGPMIAAQQIGLIGAGAGFEGASRDGSIVYFRTNAPLTPDDPNTGGTCTAPCTTGNASNSSWDLYQYKLPASGDPGEGTLARISGGPSGSADPDTNQSNGVGGAARYISEDGKRVYFVTTSPLAGADNTPPKGGTTTPGGIPGGSVRDLYLFDENASGAARYSFIAQLPSSGGSGGNAACATTAQLNGADLRVQGFGETNAITQEHSKCVRGTPSGSAVAFETTAQLSADDTDQASDIYLYDARRDELVRVSAPLPGVAAYGCQESSTLTKEPILLFCNGDFGFHSEAGRQYESELGWSGGNHYNMAEVAGHVSIYFESRSKLLPQDTNSGPGTDNYWDTYQWREGKLSLVSPGDSNDDALYSGNSLDGRDVFFETTQRIDPREIDSSDVDIYDARTGGGIPYTAPPPPCDVLAHECRGPAASAPAGAAPASSVPNGEGNVPRPRRCPKGKVRRHGHCVKRHHKRRHRHHKRHQRTANANRRAGK